MTASRFFEFSASLKRFARLPSVRSRHPTEVERASQTLRNVQSTWVKEQEVQIANDKITG
jgi:hypothetical protein